MKRIGVLLMVGGTAAALLAPATPSAQEQSAPVTTPAAATEPANQPPSAALNTVPPGPATAGQPVTLQSFSTDADGTLARFEWDFDGDRVYEEDGKDLPTIEHTFDAPGVVEVGLRVTDDDGATAEGSMSLEVLPAPAGEPAAGATGESGGTGTEPPADGPAPASGADPASAFAPLPAVLPAGHAPRADSARASARAGEPDDEAGDPEPAGVPASSGRSVVAKASASTGVTISDFKFSPASVTVAVGDTVTWTNAGPTVHTATATDGSFDTGNLAKGQSGSATFDEAGTYPYICTPHPFMKGTVRVTASGSGGGSGGSGGGSGSASGDESGDAATSGGGLPNSGSDIRVVAAIGLALLLAGISLRRLTTRRLTRAA